MTKRYLSVGFTAKDGPKEFTAVMGYILEANEPMHSHASIRKDCLEYANRNGESFNYMQINFMQFMSEDDYNSFF